jgi:hypothetical protein
MATADDYATKIILNEVRQRWSEGRPLSRRELQNAVAIEGVLRRASAREVVYGSLEELVQNGRVVVEKVRARGSGRGSPREILLPPEARLEYFPPPPVGSEE